MRDVVLVFCRPPVLNDSQLNVEVFLRRARGEASDETVAVRASRSLIRAIEAEGHPGA